jgi:RNA polymerase sigma factor, sigma-70 family
MKAKVDETTDEQTDEADHTVNSNDAEFKATVQEISATAETVSQIIDNLEIDALDEQLSIDWNNSEFLYLINDQKLMKELDRMCIELTGTYRTSPSYSWDDLRQDVIERVVKALPNYRHECKLTSWLYGIALNRLIDVHRRADNKSLPMDGTKLYGRNGEEYELDSEGLEGREPTGRYGETHRNLVEDRLLRSIQFDEMMAALSESQRSVCFKYFVERLTMEEIAAECGISKQAVCNRVKRITKRLQKYLD